MGSDNSTLDTEFNISFVKMVDVSSVLISILLISPIGACD